MRAWPAVGPLSDDEIAQLASGDVVVRDDVVPESAVAEVRAQLAAWSTDGRMTRAGMGAAQRVRLSLRGDLTCWVEEGDLAEAREWFEGLRHEIAVGARVALDGFELQAACYPGGGARYVRHVDALRGDASRRVTALLYLEPAWRRGHGGLLLAWTPAGQRRIAPRGGRLVLFRSDAVPHAVSAARAPRHALTAWMRGPTRPVP